MVNRFIRLALARYQQNSIPGCSLSPIVLADFSQLLNDRCVTVQDSHNGQYSVSVSGPAEDRGAASSNPAGSPQRVFMVTPEVMTSYDGPWMPSGESTSLAPAPSQEHDPPALGRWVGQVIVGTSAYQRRLLIREYEVYPNSVGAAPVAPSSEPGIGGRGYRLVFAEAVSI